jgi:hypothetical protein
VERQVAGLVQQGGGLVRPTGEERRDAVRGEDPGGQVVVVGLVPASRPSSKNVTAWSSRPVSSERLPAMPDSTPTSCTARRRTCNVCGWVSAWRSRRSCCRTGTDAPKTEAGVRTVALPGVLLDELPAHLAEYSDGQPDGRVFTGGKGRPLRNGNFKRAVSWPESITAAGLPEGFHFHDLRHTGNNLAAASGASTRELMHRMGHASMRAALIYQHATSERDQEIAASLSRRIEERRSACTRDAIDHDRSRLEARRSPALRGSSGWRARQAAAPCPICAKCRHCQWALSPPAPQRLYRGCGPLG